jgi:two-component system cell cycle sensor histidine kinase/response regulator CckA
MSAEPGSNEEPAVARGAAQPPARSGALEQAGAAIFLARQPDLRIVEANDAACALVGYTRAELLDLTARDLLHPDNHDALPRQSERLAGGEVVFTERTLVRKDGTTVGVEIRATTLADGVVQATIRETSERRRIEQDLRRHALMFETLLDAVIFCDDVGCITDWNPAAERLYGFTRDEAIGRHMSLLHPAEEQSRVDEIMSAVGQAGHWRGEIGFVRKDGARGTSETVVTGIRDLRGGLVGAIGVNRDITERERAAAELDELNRQRDLVLRSAGEGIWGLDGAGAIAFVNPAAARMLGWTAADMQGRESHEISHHTRRDGSPFPIDECPIYRSLQTGTATRVDDDLFWRRDGSSFPVSYTSTPIVEDGSVTGLVVVFRDVTSQHKLEEQLRQSQKAEAIGQLAGGIAHDLNNILTAIGGYTSLLLRGETSPTALGHVLGIEEAAARAADLTRQLLAFSRQQVLAPTTLDINVVVAETQGLLDRLIPESIRLVTELDPAVKHVVADPGQVTQVLMNLALNARDAMRGGGTLTISTSTFHAENGCEIDGVAIDRGEYVLISVTDDGTGMSEAMAVRIFDPFFTTKPIGEGTGLGLATVYGIVKQSGGYVFVRSALGRGTTFDVFLPATDDPVREVAAAERTSAARRETGRILLVEDEALVRELLEGALRERGHDVVTADSGAAAATALAAGPAFDVVVTDVVMPGGSGRDVAHAASAASARTRVVYMSGYARDIFEDGTLEPGAVFLQKPFPVGELVVRVEELLARGDAAA